LLTTLEAAMQVTQHAALGLGLHVVPAVTDPGTMARDTQEWEVATGADEPLTAPRTDLQEPASVASGVSDAVEQVTQQLLGPESSVVGNV
jgi:hypothetical protein